MRIARLGHAVFSVAMIGLGAVGLLHPDFVPLWNPVFAGVPAREVFIYFGALISLTAGMGLLVPRMAAAAARLLLATLFLWLLLFRLPNFLLEPPFEACWSVFPLTVMLAATWVSMSGLPPTGTVNTSALSAATTACASRALSTASA